MPTRLPRSSPLTSGKQVHQDNAADVPSQTDLKNALEKGSDEQKIETMVCRRLPTLLRAADKSTEEDPLHHAQRRSSDWSSYAHNTICHAFKVQVIEEAHVLLLRSVPQV